MGKDAPTLPEVAALLEAAEQTGPREHALACLLALHGLDTAQVCAAKVADLHRGENGWSLSIPLTAGARPVSVALAPRAADAIAAHLGDREDGPLLVDEDGQTLEAAQAQRLIRRVARSAGLGYRLERP